MLAIVLPPVITLLFIIACFIGATRYRDRVLLRRPDYERIEQLEIELGYREPPPRPLTDWELARQRAELTASIYAKQMLLQNRVSELPRHWKPWRVWDKAYDNSPYRIVESFDTYEEAERYRVEHQMMGIIHQP